jgi:chromosome segregation ATPase
VTDSAEIGDRMSEGKGKGKGNRTAQGAPEGTSPEALVASAELERRKYESRLRLDKLDDQRRALSEVCEALSNEEHMLLERIAVSEELRSRLADKVDSATRRIMQTSAEINELEQEVTALEQRLAQSAICEQELANRSGALQAEIEGARDELSSVSNELQQGRSTLVSLDRKLSLGLVTR